MIWEELAPSLIFTDVEAASYEDVMTTLGGALIQEGYAKESYVEGLIEREKEFPTGLDIDGFGVAIPHTNVSHVNKQGIAIGVLKEPVTFTQMGTDDEEVSVKLVFMLAVVDPASHIDQLQKIIAMIQDKEVLQNITNAENAEHIIEIVKEKEITL